MSLSFGFLTEVVDNNLAIKTFRPQHIYRIRLLKTDFVFDISDILEIRILAGADKVKVSCLCLIIISYILISQGNVDQKENVEAKDLELEENSNYYGQGEVLPLTEEEKIKRFVLIAFPVVFFIIAVVLAAVYN